MQHLNEGEYVEVIDWWVLPDGGEVLKASEMDLARAEAAVRDLLSAVRRHEEAPDPPEIRVARERLLVEDPEGEPESEDLKEARLLLRGRAEKRIVEWDVLQERLRRAELEREALRERPTLEGVGVRREAWLLRKITRGVLRQVEQGLVAVDPGEERKGFDQEALDEALLERTLVGRLTDPGDPAAGTEPRREAGCEPKPALDDMDLQVYQLLRGRMWTRHGMNATLAGLFRERREGAGEQGAA